MLLRPRTNQQLSKQIRQRYFLYQQCLLNSQSQHSLLLGFILELLYSLPVVCLLFTSQQFPNQILNQLFSFFKWSSINQKFDISQMPILIIFSLFGVVFIIFAIYTYVVQKANTFDSRLMVTFLKFVIYFVVPFMQFHLNVIMSPISSQVDIFFHTLSIVTLVFTFTLSILFLKLKIRPFRKNNILWRYTNQYQVQRFILNIIRTLVFVIDGTNIISLVISLLLEMYIRTDIKRYHQIQYLLQINSGSYLVITAHVTLLCYKLTNDQQLSVKLLISFLLFSLLKAFHDYFHQYNKQLIFPVCSSTPYLFYDFYFKLYEQFHQKAANYSDSNEKFYYETMKDHSRRCKLQSCPLRDICLTKKNILPQVESLVSELLNKNKRQSVDLQILEQLWNLERGKKFSFRELQGKINLEMEFIIFTVKNNETKRQVDSNIGNFINSNNIQQVSTAFFDPLLGVLKSFQEFYSEILKPKPKIQTLTRVGERIRVQVQIIQQLYMDLLKKKVLTFKAIELYIQFENYFLKCNSLSPEILKKITIIQKSTRIDDIEQIYLPAINFYPESSLIQNVNMECLSFLRYPRFQMKAKYVQDIIIPSFKYDSYFDLSQHQIQNSLMFIKKKMYKQFACGNIRINVKFINNKRIFALVFEKKKRQQGTNFILVDKNFEIVQMITQLENFKKKRNSRNVDITEINWKEMFQTHLKPHENELKLTKLIKIDLIDLQSILMCTLNKTLNPDFYIVSLRIMKNLKEVVNQRKSVIISNSDSPHMAKRSKFSFEFDNNDDDNFALLRGELRKTPHEKEKASKTQVLDFLAYQLRRNLVNFALIKSHNFAKGIKTYRLIDQGLYNIDLEDKEAYVLEFDETKKIHREGQEFGDKSVDVYIIALVIIVALILTGLSVYLLISLTTNMSVINDYFKKADEIQTFKMDFYGILASLRDVSSGLYQSYGRDWIPDVMQSYDNIFSINDEEMFSNDQVNMTYRNFSYTGNLNELVRVILSDVYALTHDLQDYVIEDIHSTSILQLTPMIELEDDKIEGNIFNNVNMLASLKNWLGLGAICGIVMFYVLIFYFCFNLVSRMKRNLSELMMISDNQAREGQQNAQKLIYVIQMSKKNFQIDFNNILPPRKRFRQRKKQKEIIVGSNLKFFSIGSLLSLFVMNIMLIMTFYIVLESKFSNFKVMQAQGQTIIQVYSNMCKQSNYIDHTSMINLTSIDIIRQELQTIVDYFDELVFSQQTNTVIKTYFLSNSCPMIYQKNYVNLTSKVTCEKATPSYEVDNPFTIGLMLYLTRQHYQIINNLTDTFAATGVYSSIFSKVFIQMATKISQDVTTILNNFIITIEIWCTLFIAVNIFYIFFAICISIYIKKKGNSVQKLVKFLNLRKEASQKANHQHGKKEKQVALKLSIKQKNGSKKSGSKKNAISPQQKQPRHQSQSQY